MGAFFHAQLRNLVKRLRSKRSDMFPGSTPGLGTKCINTSMKVFEIIKEAVSSVLFHVIDFAGAESMLRQDKFKQKDISFTRSLTGEYHLGNKIIGVVFQFDGDLLNRKYKGGPVGTEDWDLDDVKTMRGKDNKQLEDRLHTNDGIEGVSKYIKNAIIFCPKEFVSADSEDGFDVSYHDGVRHIPAVLKLLSAKKIPIRYVSTVKELFDKNVNNKQGFLEAVAIVDENTAINLGLKISKKYDVHVTYGEALPDGEIDDASGSDVRYTPKAFDITASNKEDAQSKADKLLVDLNNKRTNTQKKSGSVEWFLDAIIDDEGFEL